MSDYIHESIQLLIIKKLPPKILIRFRCVCKQWKEFIDSPSLTLHLLPLQKPQFLVQTDLEFLTLDVDPLPLTHPLGTPYDNQNPQLILIGTLHGVVCLYNCETSQFLLWNPSIRKLSAIGCSPDFPTAIHVADNCCYGFWIDPSTKEYKILVLLNFLPEDGVISRTKHTGVFYSSVRKEWSLGSAEDNWFSIQLHHVALLIGSVAYWVGYSRMEPVHEAILAFDLQKECFQSIPMPIHGFESGICVWQGSLSVMSWSRDPPHRCNLYSRQQVSWVHLFGFNLAPHVDKVFTLLEGREGRGVTLAKEKDESGEQLVLTYSDSPSVPLTRRADYIAVAPGFVESLLYV